MGRVITIVDRKKDLIISGGENIYPVEIESDPTLCTTPPSSASPMSDLRRLVRGHPGDTGRITG
jgi:acyl-CoA synthetase (AMP-forming)/AMP-acid ligase II